MYDGLVNFYFLLHTSLYEEGGSYARKWHGMVVAEEYIIQEAAEHSIDRNIR